MSIKKKLGLGVASAALGLSLVGGGTWAAFNDVETMTNSLAAGTLDLVIDQPVAGSFNVSKLVPGEWIERSFEIQNDGNVNISEVLLTMTTDFAAGEMPQDRSANPTASYPAPHNTIEAEFLKQFKIEVFNSDSHNLLTANGLTAGTTVGGQTFISLNDLKQFVSSNAFDVVSNDGLDNKEGDFNNRDSDTIKIKLTFVDDPTKVVGTPEYVQNKFMSNSVTLNFAFEAKQDARTGNVAND
ncbi:TasA family protein [Sutcliffiella halmapala]